MIMPLINAVIIFRLRDSGWQYRYRVLFILPAVIPGVVGALLWVNFLSRLTAWSTRCCGYWA